MHWIGMVFGLATMIVDAIFFLNAEDMNLFFFIFGIALVITLSPFMLNIVLENKKEQGIDEMFLEFSRNLAESVNTGTPVSKSIINMRKKNYGPLSLHVQKLANQIELGIPVHRALQNFGNDVGSPVINRAIALIMEAERAGGEIDYILDSVANSISEIEKLRKERKAAIYNLVVQGYIIFFIFIGIMLVMQFKILPLTAGSGTTIGFFTTDVNQLKDLSVGDVSAEGLTPEIITRQFLYLLIAQGVFAGLTIGKLAEGTMKAGIKHSFILSITAFLVSSGANLFLK